ncbi:MAG: molybdopterin-guanine dinucleotide biosynthesis protein B [Reyranellaceae bacterium]
MKIERALGIVGWSGVGKTTLIERLLPVYAARGLRVSTVKHCHQALALDTPGKDSWRHQQAGAVQTMLLSSAGAVIVQRTDDSDSSLEERLSALTEVDLVLVEGFRNYRFPRIEVWSPCADRPPLATQDRQIAAVVSDSVLDADVGCPVFTRDDIGAICAFTLQLLPQYCPPSEGINGRLTLSDLGQ